MRQLIIILAMASVISLGESFYRPSPFMMTKHERPSKFPSFDSPFLTKWFQTITGIINDMQKPNKPRENDVHEEVLFQGTKSEKSERTKAFEDFKKFYRFVAKELI